jgi:hypothetical protein
MCILNKCRLLFRYGKCIHWDGSVVNAHILIRGIRIVVRYFIWEVGRCVHPLNLGWVNPVSLMHDAIVVALTLSGVFSI